MMKFFKINASNDLFYRIGTGSIDNKQIKSFANDYNSYIGFFKRRIGSKLHITEAEKLHLTQGRNCAQHKSTNCT